MLSRLSAARRLPPTFTFRYYTNGRSEGSVAQSPGFGKKEKAQEDQYIRRHEQEQLQKLQASIEAKKLELEALEKAAQEKKEDLDKQEKKE